MPVNISADRLQSLVNAYSQSGAGKKRVSSKIEEYRSSGTGTTYGGSKVLTYKDMEAASDLFMELLLNTAIKYDIPQSVMDNIGSIQLYSLRETKAFGGNKYIADLVFMDDLHRNSLLIVTGPRRGERTGEGIDNIISLFDTGYDTSRDVFGNWDGHPEFWNSVSRRHRDALGFVGETIDAFNALYGDKYGVIAFISSDKYYKR